jgi:hypothetical protein
MQKKVYLIEYNDNQVLKSKMIYLGVKLISVSGKCVPVNMAWRVFRLRMEERPQIWRVAANILNKQLLTADKVWSSGSGVGRDANNSSPQTEDGTKHKLVPRNWTEVFFIYMTGSIWLRIGRGGGLL